MPQAKTILVVDDDPHLREGLTAVLGKHGYRTLEADDGLVARQLIDEHRPDLVILDMMMARTGGLAVLEHFNGRANAPPFIMITATDGARYRSAAERLGVAEYIRKPFPMERLLQRVGQLVGDSGEVPAAGPAGVLSMRCRCPGCGARIKAPLAMRGQRRTCPGCKTSFVLTLQPPEDEGTKLVPDDVRG